MAIPTASVQELAPQEEASTDAQQVPDGQSTATTTDKNDGASDKGNSIEMGIKIETGDMTVTGPVEISGEKKIINNIKNEFYTERDRVKDNFELSDAEEITAQEIDSLKRTFVEPEQLGDLQNLLVEKRILIISGESDSGRYSTALYLSCQEQDKNEHRLKIFRIHRLPENKTLKLERFIRSKNFPSDGAWIIQDALEGENTFADFLSSLDLAEIERLRQILKEKKSFIIFTVDTAINDYFFLPKIKFLVKTTGSINPILLLKKHLTYQYLENQDTFPKEFTIEDIERLLTEHQNLFNKLKTPDKVVNFARYFFRDIASGKINPVDALKKTNDPSIALKEWFDGLKSNDERWFVLALCFFNEFSWKRVWDAYWEIKSKCESETSENKTNSEEVKNIFALSDDKLLTECRAKITEHPITGSHMVSFSDPEYEMLLLDFFIQNYKSVLWKVHPYLVASAEIKEVIVRSRAAYILGRIGQIDFEKFILPLIQSWADSELDYIKATVGHLFIGILATQREVYKKRAFQELHKLSYRNLLNQWTAVTICKQIGSVNLDLALEELKNIIFRKKIDNLLELLETEVILQAIAFSLNALSIKYTPIQILLKLNEWFAYDNPKLHVVVRAAFLDREGIADTFAKIAQKKKKDADIEGTKSNHNEIIKILVRSNEIVSKIISFLGNVLATIEIHYQGEMRKDLQKRFLEILHEWSLDAYVTLEGHQLMHTIIVGIYKNPSELYKKLTTIDNKPNDRLANELIKRQQSFIFEQLKRWGQKKDDQILKNFAGQLCNEIQSMSIVGQVSENVIVKEQAMNVQPPRRQVKINTGAIEAENVSIAGGHIITSAVWQPPSNDNLPDFEFTADGVKAKREFKLAAGHLVVGEHRIEEVLNTIIAEIKNLNINPDAQRLINTNLDSIKSQLSLGQHKDKGIIRLLWDKTKSALNGLATTSDLIQLFQIVNTYLANMA